MKNTPSKRKPAKSGRAPGSESRRDKMSEFMRWETGDGASVMLLRHTGRWNEAFWLAFKAGWDAANSESQNNKALE